jgi:hypothetical protein
MYNKKHFWYSDCCSGVFANKNIFLRLPIAHGNLEDLSSLLKSSFAKLKSLCVIFPKDSSTDDLLNRHLYDHFNVLANLSDNSLFDGLSM